MPTHPHTTTPTPPAATSGSATSGSAVAIAPGHLSDRGRAILWAVAGGGAELSVSCEPDLFLHGRCCSDQAAARALVRAGLITTIGPIADGRAGFGQRVAARLTATGQHAISRPRPPRAAGGCVPGGHFYGGPGGWRVCACGRRMPAHLDTAPDPAGGPGCAMVWRVCAGCAHVEEHHLTDHLPADDVLDTRGGLGWSA